MKVKYIATSEPVKAAEVSQLLDRAGVDYKHIACASWKKYFPYCPKTKFRIAHTGNYILLQYIVCESEVRGRYEEDNSSVWTDSCVEFFFSPFDDGIYYNLECNCIGTVLLGGGHPRPDRERADLEITQLIDRHASLGRSAVTLHSTKEEWEVDLVVPVKAFFKHRIESLCGLVGQGNFYKCGDELPNPHFMSWNPIFLPHPNFHCPEFFGRMEFEGESSNWLNFCRL